MPEPIYGSVAPLWPSTTPPTFGWFQPQMAAPNRPGPLLGFGAAPGTPYPNGGLTPGYAAGPQTTLPATGPAFSGLVGPDIAVGMTAPALLTTVAMRRGQPLGPTNDQEIEDFIYDVLDLLPGAVEVEVRCESGRATLTGSVPHKRVKRDIGEIAWAIPGVADVQNNLALSTRRRSRASTREREPESPSVVTRNKQT